MLSLASLCRGTTRRKQHIGGGSAQVCLALVLSHNVSQAVEFYKGVVMVQQLVFLTGSVNMHFQEKKKVILCNHIKLKGSLTESNGSLMGLVA